MANNESEPKPDFVEKSLSGKTAKPTALKKSDEQESAQSKQDDPSPNELDQREANIGIERKEMGPPLDGEEAPLQELADQEEPEATEPDETNPDELSD